MPASHAYAKLMICGDYGVLRSAPSVIYPLKTNKLELFDQARDNAVALDKQVVKELCNLAQLNSPDHDIFCLSNIPIGSGLGSSAALCVGLIRLLAPNLNQQEIFQRALQAESYFHGKSSGADPACIAMEEAIVYKARPSEIRLLRVHQQLNKYAWLVRNSGSQRNTRELLEQVKDTLSKTDILGEIESCSKDIVKALEKGHSDKLVSALTAHSNALREMGVYTDDLETALVSLTNMGCLASKSTGAGGGGHILGLFENSVLNSQKKHLKKNDLVVPLVQNNEV